MVDRTPHGSVESVVSLDRERATRHPVVTEASSRPPVDPARSGRRKAIALTEPLHGLQGKRASLGFEVYDLLGLALVAVEIVATRMRVDRGIDRDSLETVLAGEAARHAPDEPGSEHLAVARRIVDELTERGSTIYRDADDVERRYDYVLLSEHSSGDEIYLRASNQAINLLIGALSTDIESAAIAAEAATRALIDSGNYSGAQESAIEARLRSIQFANEVRLLIADTRSDLRRAGWNAAQDTRLDEMLAFLAERLAVENGILHGMTATFADAERSDIRDAASGLIATITDCIDRHRELHAFIVEATESFRVEQDRQMFTRAASLRSLDLGPELVEPTLSLEIRGARRVLDAFTRSILGPSVPARPSVASLLDTLLRPIAERAEVGEARAALEFVDDATPDWAFAAGTVELVDELLSDLPVARRLSDLLREARARGGEDAADLIRLEALAAFGGRDLSRLAGGEAALASVDDGEILHLEGFAGADLLVGLLEPDLLSRAPVRLPSAASGPAVQLRLLPRREPTEKAEAAR
jgi:hypothetical protein